MTYFTGLTAFSELAPVSVVGGEDRYRTIFCEADHHGVVCITDIIEFGPAAVDWAEEVTRESFFSH